MSTLRLQNLPNTKQLSKMAIFAFLQIFAYYTNLNYALVNAENVFLTLIAILVPHFYWIWVHQDTVENKPFCNQTMKIKSIKLVVPKNINILSHLL